VEQALKQRLVGATVLILFATIFLPLILNGGAQSVARTANPRIQVAPAAGPGSHFNSQIVPLELPEPIKPVSAKKLDSKKAAEIAKRSDVPVVGMKAAKSKGVVQGIGLRGSKNKTRAIKKKTIKIAKVKTRKNKTIAAPVTVAGNPRWVVQVGSFVTKENARKFGQKLRGKGYSAFIEQTPADNGSDVFRVQIGPANSRNKAEATMAALEKSMKLKGIVRQYP